MGLPLVQLLRYRWSNTNPRRAWAEQRHLRKAA